MISIFLITTYTDSLITIPAVRTCRTFATRVSQLKICDFSVEAFKGFEVL